SIAVVGRRADGHAQAQIVESARGTGWVAARMKDLVEAWRPVGVAVDPSGPAGALLPDLAEQGIAAQTVAGRELGQACARMADAITEGTVRQAGQPLLNIAVRAAGTHQTGGLWVWESIEPDTDISPLKAVTLALWALTSSKQPKRSGVVYV